jgi:acetyl esterase/lipase
MPRDPREVLSRPAPGPDVTLRYGEHDDQVADAWWPRAPQPAHPDRPDQPAHTLVIFVHGGFWRSAFDRTHVRPLANDLAGRGYAVATIEFRRVGQAGGGWPGTFDDVAAALQAVPALVGEAAAPAFAVPRRPVLAGHSAGGQLALWYAAQHAGAARGVLALAPVADLALAHRLRLGDDAVTALLGGGPDDVPQRYAAVDPVRLAAPAAPVTVVHGTADDRVPISVGRAYVAAARDAGGDVTMVELPEVDHFAVIDPLSSAWPAVLDALRAVSGLPVTGPTP